MRRNTAFGLSGSARTLREFAWLLKFKQPAGPLALREPAFCRYGPQNSGRTKANAQHSALRRAASLSPSEFRVMATMSYPKRAKANRNVED
jgi:hypothetical protein